MNYEVAKQAARQRAKLAEQLQGGECACGATKAAGTSFCKRCYFQLPEALRYALYRRIGQGYESAYAKALQALGLDGEQAKP